MRVIAYVSQGSLLQQFPTISSIICLHDYMLSEASLGSMKSAKQTDCIVIIII